MAANTDIVESHGEPTKGAESWAANNGLIESHGEPTKGAEPWAPTMA